MNMTSISGTTSSSILKGMSGNKLTGLASGLDTDALVEAMTTTTRSRIAKAQQQKQLTSWKMDAFRSISSKLISFQNKYTSLSSSSALRTSSFFSKSVITPSGENSKYVKVTGNGNNADSAAIVGVKQLAEKAKYVCSAGSSDSAISGQLTETQVSKLSGKSITFTYDNTPHTITMSAKDYASVDDVVAELNAQLGNIDIGGGEKLSKVIQASKTDDGKLTLDFAQLTDEEAAVLKKDVTVKMDETMKGLLGFDTEEVTLSNSAVTGTNAVSLEKETQTLDKLLCGKELTFTYNGKSATIKLPAADDEQWTTNGNFDAKNLEGILEKELGKAFGSGRIDVSIDNDNNISLTTMKIGGGVDETSTLSVSGDYNALNAMGMKSGASNRLDLNAAVDFNYGDAESTTITITNTATNTPCEIKMKKAQP